MTYCSSDSSLSASIKQLKRKLDACGKCIPQKDLLVSDLAPAWNRSTESWEPLSLAVDDVTTGKVCTASYGLLCGVTGSSLRGAMEAVKTAPVTGGHLVPIQAAKSAQNVSEQRSEDYLLLLIRQVLLLLLLPLIALHSGPQRIDGPASTASTATTGSTTLRNGGLDSF